MLNNDCYQTNWEKERLLSETLEVNAYLLSEIKRLQVELRNERDRFDWILKNNMFQSYTYPNLARLKVDDAIRNYKATKGQE